MGTPHAINELVKEMEMNKADCTCHPYVNQYRWKGKDVYVLANNDSLNIGYVCDWIPIFYHSDGQVFTLETDYTYQDFLQDAHFINKIWACE